MTQRLTSTYLGHTTTQYTGGYGGGGGSGGGYGYARR